MTLSSQATVRKWALRSAGLLFVLAVILFVVFCILSYREEAEALRVHEPYDSIVSSYLRLVVVSTFAGIGSAIAITIYIGTGFVTRSKPETDIDSA